MKNIWWAFIGISNQGQCKILKKKNWFEISFVDKNDNFELKTSRGKTCFSKNDNFSIKNNNFHKMTENDVEINFQLKTVVLKKIFFCRKFDILLKPA